MFKIIAIIIALFRRKGDFSRDWQKELWRYEAAQEKADGVWWSRERL